MHAHLYGDVPGTALCGARPPGLLVRRTDLCDCERCLDLLRTFALGVLKP